MIKELLKIIEKNGLKKQWVAEVIGVRSETFSRWVRGFSKPNKDNQKTIKEYIELNK